MCGIFPAGNGDFPRRYARINKSEQIYLQVNFILSQEKIYTAPRIFTGENWLIDHAVCTENGMVTEILPLATVPPGKPVTCFEKAMIVPAFIDLQIYGAEGKLFAVYPEPGSLQRIAEYCRRGGAMACLPTIATNTRDTVYRCIDAVREYREKGGTGVPGLHLEGPWLNPVKRGAHIESLIHPPTEQEALELLDYGKDVIKMITLAPEQCSDSILRMILDEGIIISAGHSNAGYGVAKQAFTKGVSAVTHLFNAMSPLQHREPGLVGAVMDDQKVMASIIPDGFHVDFAAVRIAKKILGERLFVITDAVTDTTEGYYQHYPAGDKYEAAGILSGSALTMNKAVKNLVEAVGLDLAEALRMCSLYPARVLGLEQQMGKIQPGFPVSLSVMNAEYEIIDVLQA